MDLLWRALGLQTKVRRLGVGPPGFAMWDGGIDYAMASYALDALGFGIIAVDREGHVAYLNAAAKDLVEGPLCALRRIGNKLKAARLTTQTELQIGIARACAESVRGRREATHLRIAGVDAQTSDLAISILSIAPTTAGQAAHALVLLRPIERECNLECEARQLFGLTRTEAKFASSLAAGQSLLEAAKTHAVTLATARSHMKNIFRKTGVCRQSQVAALLRGAQIPLQLR